MGRRRTSLTLASLTLLSLPTALFFYARKTDFYRFCPHGAAKIQMNSNWHTRQFVSAAPMHPADGRACRLAAYGKARKSKWWAAPAGPSPSEICWNHPEIPAARVPVDTDERAGRAGVRCVQNTLALPFWGLPHRNFRSPRHRLHLLLGDWPYRRWGAPCAG